MPNEFNEQEYRSKLIAGGLSEADATLALVTYRCAVTAAWLDSNQTATAIIAAKP